MRTIKQCIEAAKKSQKRSYAPEIVGTKEQEAAYKKFKELQDIAYKAAEKHKANPNNATLKAAVDAYQAVSDWGDAQHDAKNPWFVA
jgi:ribonuclease D